MLLFLDTVWKSGPKLICACSLQVIKSMSRFLFPPFWARLEVVNKSIDITCRLWNCEQIPTVSNSIAMLPTKKNKTQIPWDGSVWLSIWRFVRRQEAQGGSQRRALRDEASEADLSDPRRGVTGDSRWADSFLGKSKKATVPLVSFLVFFSRAKGHQIPFWLKYSQVPNLGSRSFCLCVLTDVEGSWLVMSHTMILNRKREGKKVGPSKK